MTETPFASCRSCCCSSRWPPAATVAGADRTAPAAVVPGRHMARHHDDSTRSNRAATRRRRQRGRDVDLRGGAADESPDVPHHHPVGERLAADHADVVDGHDSGKHVRRRRSAPKASTTRRVDAVGRSRVSPPPRRGRIQGEHHRRRLPGAVHRIGHAHEGVTPWHRSTGTRLCDSSGPPSRLVTRSAYLLKIYRTGQVMQRIVPVGNSCQRPLSGVAASHECARLECVRQRERVPARSIARARGGANVRHLFLEEDRDGPGLLAALSTRRGPAAAVVRVALVAWSAARALACARRHAVENRADSRSNWRANCRRIAPPRRAPRPRDCQASSITSDSQPFASEIEYLHWRDVFVATDLPDVCAGAERATGA